LQRLLESPFFRSSKRSSHFLDFVARHYLTAPSEPVKERTAGVQVFGREPGYDTAADPIVRVTAGDVRRRLAQYYAEAAHQHELRIDLPAGSYVPVFGWPASTAVPAGVAAAPAFGTGNRRFRRWLRFGALIVATGVAALVLTREPLRQAAAATPFERFWAPHFEARVPVLLCTGSLDLYDVPFAVREAVAVFERGTAAADNAAPALILSPADFQRIGARFVSVADAIALVRLASLFQERGRPYQIRENQATSFADLRAAPTVLLGMFSNAWMLQLGAEFRFVPRMEGGGQYVGIQDRQHPTRQDWRIERPWPGFLVSRDFALVSRVFDQVTGRMVVVAGGITPFGTTAAVEFLTTPPLVEQALAAAPRDWERRNLQIVLKTHVIDGAAGPPEVMETHFW
jgi:hypothetical protein